MNKQLNIGLVGPLPPPSGGMANQTAQLARLLEAEGIHVEVIQVNPPYRPGWIAPLKGIRALFRLSDYLGRLWRAVGEVQLIHIMANSGWSWHLFVTPAVLIARLRGVPVVINYRGGEAETFFRKSFFWVKPILKRAKVVAVPSGFLEQVFQKYHIETTIVPNIIDLTRFSPADKNNEVLDSAFDEPNGPHIVVARNLEPIYDMPTAIKAFSLLKKRYPNARLTVAGMGPELEKLIALTNELELRDAVYFPGRLDNEEMVNLYKSADLSLNPSLVDNMPISILEALASAVPVVSTNVGGIPFLVENGVTARLVEPGDAEAMAQAAQDLLSNTKITERIIQAGINLVHQFTWPIVRNKLFKVYEMALGESAESHASLKSVLNKNN